MKLHHNTFLFALLLGMHSALPPFSIDSSLPALPAIGVALSAVPTKVQWTLSAFLIGLASGQMFWGPLSDAKGRRPVLIAGMCLYVFGGIGCALAPNIDVLIGMRLLQGLGACAGVVISRAIVRDVFTGQTAIAKQSLLQATSTSAMLMAPIVGGFLVEHYGWRVSYAMLPTAGMMLVLAASLFLRETAPLKSAQGFGFFQAVGAVVREPMSIGFALFNATIFGGLFAFVSGSSAVLIGTYGFAPGLFGIVFAASAVSLLFGSGTSALTIRRYGSLRLRRLAMIVVVIADLGLIATAVLNLGPWALLISIALLTYAVGIILPNAISSAMAYVPQVAGTASGVVGLIQFVTGAISAWMIGLYHPGQISGMVTIIIPFTLVSLCFGVGLDVLERRRGGSGPQPR